VRLRLVVLVDMRSLRSRKWTHVAGVRNSRIRLHYRHLAERL
jgi:hypothetical protein